MADQGAIWEEVHRKQGEFACYSPTSALHDVYEYRRHDIDSYLRVFHPLPNQAGAVFAVNGEIIGVEAFDSPETFRKMFSKLLRSDAQTAMSRPYHETRGFASARWTTSKTPFAPTESFQPVGLGCEAHLNSEHVTGCPCPVASASSPTKTPVAAASSPTVPPRSNGVLADDLTP